MWGNGGRIWPAYRTWLCRMSFGDNEFNWTGRNFRVTMSLEEKKHIYIYMIYIYIHIYTYVYWYGYILIWIYRGYSYSIVLYYVKPKISSWTQQTASLMCLPSLTTVSSQYRLNTSWMSSKMNCIGCLGLSNSSPKLSSQGLPSMTRSESSTA